MNIQPDPGGIPAPGDVRLALERILASDPFSRSPKLSRLLTYLVETRLEGREEDMRETAIAAKVFDQDEEFNPRANPIVRVNASRLRNLLKSYYAETGADDRTRILLPDVGYAPDFSRVAKAAGASGTGVSAAAAAPSGSAAPGTASDPSLSAPDCPDDDAPRITLAARGETPSELGTPPRSEEAYQGWTVSDLPGERPQRRLRDVLGGPSTVAFVLMNLIIACLFALLINSSSALQGTRILSLPPVALNGKTQPLVMLCNNARPDETGVDQVYPVTTRDGLVFCTPLQVHETLIGVTAD